MRKHFALSLLIVVLGAGIARADGDGAAFSCPAASVATPTPTEYVIPNNTFYQGYENDGVTTMSLIGTDTGNEIIVGGTEPYLKFYVSGTQVFYVSGAEIQMAGHSIGSIGGLELENSTELAGLNGSNVDTNLAEIDNDGVEQFGDAVNAASLNINNATTIGGAAAHGSGTLTVANGLYLGATAYTNPDYVFDRYYLDYRSPKHADYSGLKPLGRVEAYVRAFHELPRVVDFDANGNPRPMDIFTRADRVLEKVEESYLYLFDHERRIRDLAYACVSLFALIALLCLKLASMMRRLRKLEGAW